MNEQKVAWLGWYQEYPKDGFVEVFAVDEAGARQAVRAAIGGETDDAEETPFAVVRVPALDRYAATGDVPADVLDGITCHRDGTVRGVPADG